MLPYYVRHFDSVELNNTFYRLPTPPALQTWRTVTPPEFCFAVKGSRFLTHMKKLKDPGPGLHAFLGRVELLEEKLGPILFQLPPRWRCDSARLAAFLAALPKRHRYSFELRDPSWHTPDVCKLLTRHNAAFCMYELAGFRSPYHITADFAYIRLHGPGKAYQGSYEQKALQAWSERIRDWHRQLRAIYVYFDNDQAGYAARNALELKRALQPHLEAW
jgi:uncharacterized protein YecE (DUF72 family)